MSFLGVALKHAENGFFVFPAQENKRPVFGFNDWENQASNVPEQIAEWWRLYPEALPAVAPGRSGHAVIDVDRHADSDDGFASLRAYGQSFDDDVVSRPSLSGNGTHLWFRHRVGSLNAVLPGVDRKAQGGYVVAPYELPMAETITTILPELLREGRKGVVTERKTLSSREFKRWMLTVGAGEMSDSIREIVARFSPRGNQQMSVSIAQVVKLAARGHSGAAEAFDQMLKLWLSVLHATGDPEAEFSVNVRSAVEKFGEPPPPAEEKFQALLSPPPPITDVDALVDALAVYCDSLDPLWRQRESNISAYRRCGEYIRATPADATERFSLAKEAMKNTIGQDHG